MPPADSRTVIFFFCVFALIASSGAYFGENPSRRWPSKRGKKTRRRINISPGDVYVTAHDPVVVRDTGAGAKPLLPNTHYSRCRRPVYGGDAKIRARRALFLFCRETIRPRVFATAIWPETWGAYAAVERPIRTFRVLRIVDAF